MKNCIQAVNIEVDPTAAYVSVTFHRRVGLHSHFASPASAIRATRAQRVMIRSIDPLRLKPWNAAEKYPEPVAVETDLSDTLSPDVPYCIERGCWIVLPGPDVLYCAQHRAPLPLPLLWPLPHCIEPGCDATQTPDSWYCAEHMYRFHAAAEAAGRCLIR